MAKTVPRILHRRPAETRGLTSTANAQGGMALALPSVAGITVTPQAALTFTAVFAAINVISRDFASLPPSVNRLGPRGGKKVVADHPAHDRLRVDLDPEAPRSNALRGRQAKMAHTLGWGNGYWRIKRYGDGDIAGFELLHPGTTKPKETKSGRLYYEARDDRGGDEERLLPEQVFHMAGLGFDGVTGYSPVAMSREAVGLGKAAEQFGSSFYGNGANPGGVLKTPRRLSETAQKNLRESIYRVHQGSNQGNHLLILEEGLEYQGITLPQDQAQFLATRAFQVIEVARMYALPPHKIGDYSQSHLANVEEANLDYLTTTLTGWVEAWEAEANLKLLSAAERRAGLFISLDMTRLLRAAMKARIDYYKGLWEMGAISADEVRARENFNPIGRKLGGMKRFVQANLMRLDRAGDDAAGAATTPPAGGAQGPGASDLDSKGGGDEPSAPESDRPVDDGGGDDDA